ncbi:serine/threonine-protein kinase [Mycobacterium sp. Aquia_213]|uniref:serine/threonine-protein kinase n=1 Tax=Mycobacterium sp. Aquia_213 TaxID=2991728 RepID=UPI002D1E38F0|nr:serine/threonine-protein kinase [Mycobacterium sp. Aquia_213]
MPLSEGAQFAGYTVVRLLGAGGMGEVYLVRHPRLPRFEALKILGAEVSADPGYQQRFNREAELASGLWHPHIVGVQDRGEFEGRLWIAMDYVDGTDLDALMDQKYPGGMPAGEVVEIVTAVGAALDHAHHRGLLHRDIKPGNIMISRPDDGSPPRIVLCDFGISRPVDDTTGLTVTNMTVGTVPYCAPEQLSGRPLDGRADQYALAATAYFLLTGAKLFPHVNPVAVINAHLRLPAPLLSGLRPDLASANGVFARALAKNPAERFDRCGEFAAALAQHLSHVATGHTPLPPATPAPASEQTLPVAAAGTEATRPILPPRPHYPPLTPAGYPGPPIPPPPSPWGPPFNAGPQPPRRRKRPVALVLSVLAVLAVVAAVGAFAASKIIGGDAAKRAEQDREAARLAGQHYLEALAVGDARTALSVAGDQPATPQLLSDKVLRAQLATTPITDIKVANDPAREPGTPSDAQRLVMAAKFGVTPTQVVIWAHKKDGQWKLDTTAAAITVNNPPNAAEAMKTVAIYGVGTNGSNPISVFPGVIQVGSTNRYIDITAPSELVLLEALTAPAANRPSIQPAVALNDAGRQASLAAVDAKLRSCFNGVAPPPECCPPGSCPRLMQPPPGVDQDTAKLENLENTQDMTYDLDPNTMTVSVSGTFNYRAQVLQYSQPIALRDTMRVVDSHVDLTKDPPAWVHKPH